MKNNNLIVFDNADLTHCLKGDMGTIKRVKITSSAIDDRRICCGEIKEAVEEFRRRGVDCYIGGGVTESAIENNALPNYIDSLHSLGIRTIELSNSYISLDSNCFLSLLEMLKRNFEQVLVEIGSKDNKSSYAKSYIPWKENLNQVIECGANGIIIEGGIGNVGIYDEAYRTKTLLLLYLMKELYTSKYNGDIIVEASSKETQKYIISLFGSNVQVGNIFPDHLNYIDGLREKNKQKSDLDKLFEFIDTIFSLCEEHGINPDYFFFADTYKDLNLDKPVKKHIRGIEAEIKRITGKGNESLILILKDPLAYLRSIGITM